VIAFRVDRAGGEPAYVQIIRQVRDALRLGILRPGDRLPTVREVVAGCAVNSSTVLRAYRDLEQSGLVEARQGTGTFISAALGTADPNAMARLHAQLTGWVREAGEAGLEDEDMRAVFGAVLADPSARPTNTEGIS
jgi:GntR family transcriptional regulator